MLASISTRCKGLPMCCTNNFVTMITEYRALIAHDIKVRVGVSSIERSCDRCEISILRGRSASCGTDSEYLV
jgi:hypothetical protein